MAGLLQTLVRVSEKAAHIARLCRQEDALFHLLVAEKTGADRNERFVQDFKTLADVLIQEVIKHDVGKEVGAVGRGVGRAPPPWGRRGTKSFGSCRTPSPG
uniref:INPP phosphatase n=1 Tax=Dromaius novaehollandiae TaxID=8790 RepID=A0A8C4P4Q9_DRONO